MRQQPDHAPTSGPVILVAPLCLDRVRVRGESERLRPGGAGLYAAWALTMRGAEVILHSPLAEEDRDLLEALPPGTRVVVHPTRRTTRFRLEVEPDDPDRRRLFLEATADPIDPSLIGSVARASYVLLGPLWPTDLSDRVVRWLRRLERPYDLGVQGLIRSVDAQGAVRLDTSELRQVLPPPRVLAGDEEEIAALRTRWRAAETIATRASRGARIWLRGARGAIEISAAPAMQARHPVGLGDTFLAVYGWERSRGVPPVEAGAHAARASRDLLERGPFWEA